jgi:hypothetical protein
MLPIISFHANETALFVDRNPFRADESFYPYLYAVFQYLSFSGYTVLGLTAFLYGMKGRTFLQWIRLILLLLVGVLVLAWVEGDGSFYVLNFDWDIYAFLLCAFFSLFLIQLSSISIYVFGGLGLALLCIPFWNLVPEPLTRQSMFSILIGSCRVSDAGGGGWPVLPWIGLPWFFFAAGHVIRQSVQVRSWLGSWSWSENVIWFSLLVASVFAWNGGYGGVPLGPGFGCFTFRRPPLVFWSHMIWILFAMRLAFVPWLNRKFSKIAAVQWVSGLQWSKNFGLCYLVQLIWLGLGSFAHDLYLREPRYFDLYILSILPLTEITVRALRYLLLSVRRKYAGSADHSISRVGRPSRSAITSDSQ